MKSEATCRRARRLAAVLLPVLIAPLGAAFPQGGGGRAQAPDEIVRVETNLVTVPVSVLDREGRYVGGLTKEDFLIFEDGVAQEVAFFATAEQPITVALVLDASGSMEEYLPAAVSAAKVFARQMRPADRLLVVSFNENVRLLLDATVRDIGPGTTVDIRSRRGSRQSRLHDVVASTLRKRLNKVGGRKAMLLLTDGLENGSSATESEALREAEENEALIYAVQYPPPARLRRVKGKYLTEMIRQNVWRATSFLRGLAARTGGRHFAAENISDIERAFAAIGDELRRQYSLGYYPKSRPGAGRERRIQVKVRRPNLSVHARPGYTAAAAPKAR